MSSTVVAALVSPVKSTLPSSVTPFSSKDAAAQCSPGRPPIAAGIGELSRTSPPPATSTLPSRVIIWSVVLVAPVTLASKVWWVPSREKRAPKSSVMLIDCGRLTPPTRSPPLKTGVALVP